MIFTNSYFLRFYLRFFNYKDATGIFIGSGSRIKRGTEIGDGSRINGKIIIKGSGKTKIATYSTSRLFISRFLAKKNHLIGMCNLNSYRLRRYVLKGNMNMFFLKVRLSLEK